jgi:hypothetical protein
MKLVMITLENNIVSNGSQQAVKDGRHSQYADGKYPHQGIFLPMVHLKFLQDRYRHGKDEYISKAGQNSVC